MHADRRTARRARRGAGATATATATVIAAALLTAASCSGTGGAGDADAEVSTSAPSPPGTRGTTATGADPTAPTAPATTRPPTTSAASTSTTSTIARGAPSWQVDTAACADERAATAPIVGTLRLASVMPLTGGIAAAAFSPLAAGLRASIQHANAQRALGDVTIELTIGDDQFLPERTPAVVDELLAGGAHVLTAVVGTANNLAVRERLNAACVPHLNAMTGSQEWAEVDAHPWTTGFAVPYALEADALAAHVATLHPDGARVALLTADTEFGRAVAERFARDVGDVEVVLRRTLDPGDPDPPAAAVAEVVAARPEVVLTAPVGAGCIGVLSELGGAIARDPTWTPLVAIPPACASARLLTAAGAAADGIVTTGNLIDTSGPTEQLPAAAGPYVEAMTATGAAQLVADAAAGWTAGEVTVEILRQAAASPSGLTRASIIEAARSLTTTPSLGLPGVVFRTDGERDPWLAGSVQVLRYEVPAAAGTGRFVPVGELVGDR